MLLGRERERARIAALLESAHRGRGGALVIRGEAGIGGRIERLPEQTRIALAVANDPNSLRLAAEALFSAGLDNEAVRIARSAVDLARARSAHNALTQSLEFLAQAEARRGRLLDGLAAVVEEIDLVVALGQTREERYASVAAAWIEAALGRDVDGRGHAARASELEGRMGWSATRNEALGVLELAMGRPGAAVEVFERVPLDSDRLGADAIAPRSFVPAYIEALVHTGRSAEARPIAASYAEIAEHSGRSLAIALARRCQGLAAGSVDELESAIEILGAISNPYEQARTRLCLGQLLRRRGKRAEASAALMLALEAFTAIGADGWAERALSELSTTGVADRRPALPLHSELTPQERTVTQLVASGLSNREIAERLFVTTNTVETHLRHIFQKLDVHSRTQLAIAFRG